MPAYSIEVVSKHVPFEIFLRFIPNFFIDEESGKLKKNEKEIAPPILARTFSALKSRKEKLFSTCFV